MVAVCLAAAMLCQGETAPELVGKMLRYYDAAQTLTGTIRFVQSVGEVSVGIDTSLQYEKPSKLYIRQDRRSSEPRTFLVTSDGKFFSYDLPEGRLAVPGERLYEPVEQNGRFLGYRDIYAIVSRSLGDRSAALDIAIARLDDLKFIRGQWATVEYAAEQPGNGVKVVTGDWRAYASAPVSGRYTMWIGENGELKRFAQREVIQPEATVLDERFRERPAQLNVGPQQVNSVWEVDLKVNGEPDQKLFKVVK
jgi:hypothetical protein